MQDVHSQAHFLRGILSPFLSCEIRASSQFSTVMIDIICIKNHVALFSDLEFVIFVFDVHWPNSSDSNPNPSTLINFTILNHYLKFRRISYSTDNELIEIHSRESLSHFSWTRGNKNFCIDTKIKLMLLLEIQQKFLKVETGETNFKTIISFWHISKTLFSYTCIAHSITSQHMKELYYLKIDENLKFVQISLSYHQSSLGGQIHQLHSRNNKLIYLGQDNKSRKRDLQPLRGRATVEWQQAGSPSALLS